MSGADHSLPGSLQQLSLNTDKPTQVVTPAVQHKANPPPKTYISPAIATIDRLLSGSPLPPPPPVVRSDMDGHMLEQLRAVKELLTAQEDEAQRLKNFNQELQERLDDTEDKIKKLSEQNEEFAEREKQYNARVGEKVRNNKQMSAVMEEYERTISSLIGEHEAETRRWGEERVSLARDRDEAASHLASMEHSFNDVHTKYERCKAIIQEYKSNEIDLNRKVIEKDDAIKKLEARYETLRQHAMSQLNRANQELDAMKKSHQTELLKLNAMLKKSDVHASSLQEALAQKIKDNEELTAICDELINKVG